ncbi:MAG: site-specific integrase [Deltaproteobacteria bacterium]|jgi:integrase|nr:site-specific integrase [Deltaproteobacteria bacterium]
MKRIHVDGHEGVFYRLCKRIWKGQQDKSYDICWQESGKKRWLTLGRESEGMTALLALERRIQIITAVKNPKPENRGPLVDEVLDLYLADRGNNRPCRSACERWFRPAFGGLRMSELTRSRIEALVASMTDEGKSSGTVDKYLNYLSAAVNHAIRTELWNGRNPLSGMPRPKTDNKSERWLTEEEAFRFIDELTRRSPWWGDAASFSLLTGAELTEIYRLRADDLIPGADSIMVTAKGGRREPLLLSAEAREILERRVRDEPRADGLIFGVRDTGTVRAAVKACGFDVGKGDAKRKVWFHTFRHTFATWMVMKEVEILDVQKLMRHRNIQMTMRYAQHVPDRLTSGLEVISRIMASK